MPLPNGVDPTGIIHPTCPSAAWMGNRGVLHDVERRLLRSWSRKQWVTCQLSYNGWSRKPLMKPNQYTELFFLDEATAFSAGHRPCGMCRKARLNAFKTCWLLANGHPEGTPLSEIDNAMHAERMSQNNGTKWVRALHTLPAGVVVRWNDVPHLWTGSVLRPWTSWGYGDAIQGADLSAEVMLLTPPSIVNAIAAGYTVQLHPGAS